MVTGPGAPCGEMTLGAPGRTEYAQNPIGSVGLVAEKERRMWEWGVWNIVWKVVRGRCKVGARRVFCVKKGKRVIRVSKMMGKEKKKEESRGRNETYVHAPDEIEIGVRPFPHDHIIGDVLGLVVVVRRESLSLGVLERRETDEGRRRGGERGREDGVHG